MKPIADTYIRKAVLCAQDPSVQLTQLDWLGNLSSLLQAAEDCFATTPGKVYHKNLRAWNTSDGSDGANPYPERGPHKLPGVCSLKWGNYSWEMHLLTEDFLEVIEGLFADGRLNATRQPEGLANDFEVYLAGDFTISQQYSSGGYRYYYELSYVPATMGNLRLFTLVEPEDLDNVRNTLERLGIHLEWGSNK